jgi:hypothetical protein
MPQAGRFEGMIFTPSVRKKAWSFIQREYLSRRLPHGLFGPGYLFARNSQQILQHRHLWWSTHSRIPRPLWLTLETLLWLRWILWYAIPACQRILKKSAYAVETEEGIPCNVQRRRILYLALYWSIPPSAYYQLRLYRRPQQALDYIYDSEAAAYHQWRSQQLCSNRSTTACRLQDKAQLTQFLTAQGIPMAPILASVHNQNEKNAPVTHYLVGQQKIFCKMNSGNQGRGAFAVWHTDDGVTGQAFTGKPLSTASAIQAAWNELLQLDQAIIQPYLQNHPLLKPLLSIDELITFRFISQWQQREKSTAKDRLSYLSAVMEIPFKSTTESETRYAIVPIDATTGVTGSVLIPIACPPEIKAQLLEIEQATQNLVSLPDWQKLVVYSYQAHRHFPEIYAIAWDWALTPQGPVLLEGNVGWGTVIPQMIHGGFLATR